MTITSEPILGAPTSCRRIVLSRCRRQDAGAPGITMKLLRNFALACLPLAGLVMGCGGKNFRPYIHNAAATTAITRQTEALSLMVDPMLDVKACKINFGMDCPQKGILPVYLVVKNGNSAVSFRIVSREIWFGSGPENKLVTRSGLEHTNAWAAGSSLAIAGGVVAGISPISGLLIIGGGMKATDDAESIRENFVIKQFQNVTLPPGKSAEGFVYYAQTGPIQINRLPSINIPVCNLQTQQTNTFSLPLGAAP